VAYALPDFGLVCQIYTNSPNPFTVPPRLTSPCNLAWGKRVSLAFTGSNVLTSGDVFPSQLLLPALTDIRGPRNASGVDFVEVPSGSGRRYVVYLVEDLGKGYANEHRLALIVGVGTWPTPIP